LFVLLEKGGRCAEHKIAKVCSSSKTAAKESRLTVPRSTLTSVDQAAHEECYSELRVEISLLFSGEHVPTNTRDILPLPVESERNASSSDKEVNKQQASEILTDAGLQNSQVRFIILFLVFEINGDE